MGKAAESRAAKETALSRRLPKPRRCDSLTVALALALWIGGLNIGAQTAKLR
jgi:hypothetical protein